MKSRLEIAGKPDKWWEGKIRLLSAINENKTNCWSEKLELLVHTKGKVC